MEFEKKDVVIGAFVMAAVLVFVGVFVALNRERMTTQTYTLKIHLPNIAGIEKGVEVIYKGYKAGAVDRVKIEYEPEFRFVVRLEIRREIRLANGTVIMVRNKGFGGSKFLELVPPAEGENKGGTIEDDALLPVLPEMDLMAKANEVMGEVQKLVKDLQKGGAGRDLQQTLMHAKSAVANLDHVLNNTNLLLAENRAALKVTLEHSSQASVHANALMAKNAESLDRSLKRLDQALAHVPSILANVEELTADLKKHPWRLVRKGDPDEKVVVEHKHELELPVSTEAVKGK